MKQHGMQLRRVETRASNQIKILHDHIFSLSHFQHWQRIKRSGT